MNSELYRDNELKLVALEEEKNNLLQKDIELYNKLKKIEEEETNIKKFQEELKNKIKEEMEKIYNETENEVIENQFIRIKYTPSYDKVIIDSDKLKKEYEDVYLNCLKKSTVKSQIRITIK